jgi:monoamine oxidase
MNRRDFLKRSGYFSLGSMLLPSTLLSSCSKDPLAGDINYNGKVLVIGAGAAGLYAAYLLNSKNINVQILEAGPTLGGRLGKLTGFADFPLDLGAEWLHGRNNILGDLINSTGTTITLDNSSEKYWFNNQMVSNLPRNVHIFEAGGLPDISYKDFAIQRGLGNEYRYIVEGLAGDKGAAASRISVYYSNVEEDNWSSGDDDYKFRETYFDLIDRHIATPVKDKIIYNAPVMAIDYSQDNIVVTDASNRTYTANKVIITVPITILKANTIRFTPALPAEKTSAFSKIGMDAGMKVFLKFNRKFFDQNIWGGKICASYADESIGKNGQDAVLMAFIMGEQAEHLDRLGTDAAITQALLQELDSMYNNQASAAFMASHVQNFTRNPYIRGAYSYSTMGMGQARQVAARSVADKLFFAGEAMNINGHHQTVFGAAETGKREVINLVNTIR